MDKPGRRAEAVVEDPKTLQGSVLTYRPDGPIQPGQSIVTRTRGSRSVVPEFADFVVRATDMSIDEEVLASFCVAMLQTTSMPEAGPVPYAHATLGMTEEGDLLLPASQLEQLEQSPPPGPHQRAAAICRLAVDITVGPYADVSPDMAANMLIVALEAAAFACGDIELAFYYLDQEIEHLQNYYLARLKLASEPHAMQGANRDIGPRQETLARLKQVLVLAGLQSADYDPRLPANYFGAGKS